MIFDEKILCDDLMDFTSLATFEEDSDECAELNYEEGGEVDSAASEHRDTLCGTCTEVIANCAHVPCGHLYFCMDCYLKWLESTDADRPSCPICRQEITTVLKLQI